MNTIKVDDLLKLKSVAVFFDIDGTLAPIKSHANLVVIEPEILSLLDAFEHRFNGAVAILTGRPLEEAGQLLGARRMAIAAEHGAVVRTRDGIVQSVNAPNHHVGNLFKNALDGAQTFVGVRVERKTWGIAIHYRAAPIHEAKVHALAYQLRSMFEGVELLYGKMVVELKPSGVDKGIALRNLLVNRPFAGRQPVFFGDDVTDESAFIQAQAADGIGVKIGTEQSNAAFKLARQADLLPLLRQWLCKLESPNEGPSGPP